MSELLQVSDLTVRFGRRRAVAVDSISFTVAVGQRLGLIGESGSGKTVTALAIMGLLPGNAHVTGSVRLGGRDLLGMPDAELSGLRGTEMGMVFQEPMTALDPTMRVGRQVAEALMIHRRDVPRDQVRDWVLAMLAEVDLTDPAGVAASYPHQLSGGQRQRALIAMALINRPRLLICDEPTTALDVTVQAKVLALLDRELAGVARGGSPTAGAGSATLFISHDLAVVSQVCDEVMVMWRGQIVERGPVGTVLTSPRHPYTRGLVATARLDLVTPGDRLPVVEDYLAAGDR